MNTLLYGDTHSRFVPSVALRVGENIPSTSRALSPLATAARHRLAPQSPRGSQVPHPATDALLAVHLADRLYLHHLLTLYLSAPHDLPFHNTVTYFQLEMLDASPLEGRHMPVTLANARQWAAELGPAHPIVDIVRGCLTIARYACLMRSSTV